MSCKRCGRKLTSEASKKRGYGGTCYAKLGADQKKSEVVEKETEVIEENFVDEIREKISEESRRLISDDTKQRGRECYN